MKWKDFSAGFTLFEMSIVLAIVGLIAGGIVALQSYLKGAQLTTVMQEARYYIDGFNRFESTYAAVPGDMAAASGQWASAGDGDGNGFIRAVTTNTNEYFYAFEHLALAKLIQGSYTGATGSGGAAQAVLGSNIPRAAMDGVGYFFDHPDAASGEVAGGDALYFVGKYFHVLRIAGQQTTDTGMPIDYFLTPKEAYQLDSKFDDGKPGLGWVTTPENSTAANCADSDTPALADYTVTNGTKACYFILKMQ